MDQLYSYITSPDTIISFVIFVFWLWAIYTNVTGKLKELETRLTKLEDLDLDSRLTKMQVDLDWIKTTLNELKKK
jgi:hypothetical protein